ncbi:site-specific DNA-methyltransferase [Caballeronia sp. KNU42]
MSNASLLSQLDSLNEQQLRRLLVEHLTKQKLGLYWEANAIERDKALNANLVMPVLRQEWSMLAPRGAACANLIIEGDNYDSLRMLRSTHRGKIGAIYIDPPYNTGNKDWVYNDSYVGANDRWRHSQWLEFLYRRLELARDLLTPTGVMMVSINDENRARLELLLDDVMPGRRLGTITWRTRQGSNADQQCFLSVDHEHILVYGNPEFRFKGFEKTYEMYGNSDNDPRGDWRPDNLTLGFSYKERPNLYYPLIDPDKGISYPSNPDRVWVYASQDRLKEGQTVQTRTMEEFIALGQIIFPSNQRVETWSNMAELFRAIDTGDVPKSGKTPLLRRDLPNLDFWIGRPVGFGRPQFKRYKADLRNQTQPLSSWIVPTFEEGDYELEANLVSGTNQEGARLVTEIFGDRAFNYAKPLSLIKGLLEQATGPNDIVLDFFAGSGTTAQAVLELNAKDGGQRKFILCSSTEATKKERNKNLCRDVCAERVRRVIKGYGSTKGLGGTFAYLQLELVEPADLAFDVAPHQAFELLSLRENQTIQPVENGSVQCIAGNHELAILMCTDVTVEAVEKIASWPARRLAVYSTRPDAVLERLAAFGVQINSYSLIDALLRGQTTFAN